MPKKTHLCKIPILEPVEFTDTSILPFFKIFHAWNLITFRLPQSYLGNLFFFQMQQNVNAKLLCTWFYGIERHLPWNK